MTDGPHRAAREHKKLARAQLERQCLELRLAGATYEDIARQLALPNYMLAYRAYLRAIRNIPAPAAHRARTEMLERLNRLRLHVWSKFQGAGPAELATLVVAALRI